MNVEQIAREVLEYLDHGTTPFIEKLPWLGYEAAPVLARAVLEQQEEIEEINNGLWELIYDNPGSWTDITQPLVLIREHIAELRIGIHKAREVCETQQAEIARLRKVVEAAREYLNSTEMFHAGLRVGGIPVERYRDGDELHVALLRAALAELEKKDGHQ